MKTELLFSGITRKIALAFIVLSFLGWMLYVAGFIKLIHESKDINPDYDPAKDVSTYSYWVASVVGPVVYIVAVIHALLWKQLSGVVGSITAVLSMWYITALSFGLVAAGIDIRNEDIDEETYHKLLFAGGFLAVLGWTGVLALWPWYMMDIDSEYFGI